MTVTSLDIKSSAVSVLFIFQCCSRVLLPPDDRKTTLEALRRPALSNLARKGILKKVNTKCRKLSQCPYCEGLNGESYNTRILASNKLSEKLYEINDYRKDPWRHVHFPRMYCQCQLKITE